MHGALREDDCAGRSRVIGRLVPHRPTPYNCHCSRPFIHPNEGGDPLSSPRDVRNLVWASDRLIGS